MPSNVTVGDPGAQGETVLGMQGWGVRTPSAAAVAAATCGLARLVHIPKVGMFSNGAKSMMVAAFDPPTVIVGLVVATSGAGGCARDMEHEINAPSQANSAMVGFLSMCPPDDP